MKLNWKLAVLSTLTLCASGLQVWALDSDETLMGIVCAEGRPSVQVGLVAQELNERLAKDSIVVNTSTGQKKLRMPYESSQPVISFINTNSGPVATVCVTVNRK